MRSFQKIIDFIFFSASYIHRNIDLDSKVLSNRPSSEPKVDMVRLIILFHISQILCKNKIIINLVLFELKLKKYPLL